MYEADYLRAQIGLEFPSIFGMEISFTQIESRSRNRHLYSSTWNMDIASGLGDLHNFNRNLLAFP